LWVNHATVLTALAIGQPDSVTTELNLLEVFGVKSIYLA